MRIGYRGSTVHSGSRRRGVDADSGLHPNGVCHREESATKDWLTFPANVLDGLGYLHRPADYEPTKQ